uniref:Tail assembly chaperone protein n=1 Tax=Firmicutes phage HS08 TaxID=3056391 RepID=A0AA50AD14_9VIRU|nr:MAG: tail assembly chaperone protein [Firmicutes phage HS08]
MNLTINGNDYELNFGLKFCREISKGRSKNANGIDIRLGIENATTALYTGDVLILPELIKAATATCDKKPSDKDIEEYLDNHEDLGKLCDDFLEQLKTQSATKKKALQVWESMKKAEKEEKEKERVKKNK